MNIAMKVFHEMISEMQNEEPYTLSYVRILSMFRAESVPMIFEWTTQLFLSNGENLETVPAQIDILNSCLGFDLNTVEKAKDKNTYNSVRVGSEKDTLNGKLTWCSPDFVQKIVSMHQTFAQE